MKIFRFPNNFELRLASGILFIIFEVSGCTVLNTIANMRGNQNSATKIASGSDNAGTAYPTAQTSAQCQNILRGDRRNKPIDRGELPADMPVPRGSLLCGYVNGQRAAYYINDTVDKNALAHFYRDALPRQGFDLQMDNPSEGGGKFMVFGRGASESIQIQTTLGSAAETINKQQCNHFRRTDSETGEVMDTWVSQATDYALRIVFRNRSG